MGKRRKEKIMSNWKKVYAQPWLKITLGEGTSRDGISIYETFDALNMALVNIMERYRGKVFDTYSKPFFKPFVTFVKDDLDIKCSGNRYIQLSDLPADAFKSVDSMNRYFEN